MTVGLTWGAMAFAQAPDSLAPGGPLHLSIKTRSTTPPPTILGGVMPVRLVPEFIDAKHFPSVGTGEWVGVFGGLSFASPALYASTTQRPRRFITPFLGYNFGGDSRNCISLTDCQEKHINVGLSIGSTGRVAGLEEDMSYARNFFGAGTNNAVLTAMTNLLVTIPLGPIQPYVVGGVGLIRPHASSNPLQVVTSKSAFGSDFGGGLTLMFGRRVGVRGDIRRFHTLQDVTLFLFSGEKLDFWRASAGITFRY